ncbi:MAG: iron-containing alcohol dehydrogenase [Betaproteobacteria bacterium]|nr:iron-containing alcohol dehydrogenase [Betaproteobacteria bacterium]
MFIVTGKTLNRQTPLIRELSQALGMRYVACFDECMEHTPRRTVIEAARAVRLAKPDLILTVGGGTAIDTVKVLLIALAEGLEHEDELSAWHLAVNPDGSRRIPKVKSPPMRQIAVSTTLSAAEFSNLGGCTDEKRKVKDAYMGTEIGPAAVILDPRATLYTPTWLWLSTGLRALDHAIEGLCSVNPSPLIHALGLEAVRLLSKGLRQSNQHPDDLQARLDCLQGAWLAGIGIMRVPFGASHGIGHSLGAVTGMSHGYTSDGLHPRCARRSGKACRRTWFAESIEGLAGQARAV